MTIAIGNKEPNTGRLQKEDNTIVNIADLAVPKAWTFHNAVTTAAVPAGAPFVNEARKTMTFGIGGTSTSQVYEFRGVDSVGNDNLITCYKATDSTAGTGTSVKGETWQAPIEGLVSFYVKLISISGGTGIVMGEATV